MTVFHTRLKELRQENGLTLKKVSSALDIPLSTYANYEQGAREPSLDMIVSLCKFFDVSADYLLGLSEY